MNTYSVSSGSSYRISPPVFADLEEPFLSVNIGAYPKNPLSFDSIGSKINFVMITDKSGSGSLSPRAVEDELDLEIAAMSIEERLAVIMSMAGSWADRDDITIIDGHVNPDQWGFEDLTDLYDNDLPV